MTNNDELDGPDLEPDINQEQDADFGDFGDEPKAMSIGEVIKKNPLIKFGLVAVGVVAIIATVSMMGSKKSVTPNSVVTASEKNFKDAPGTKEVTPEMKAAIEDKNEQRTTEAQNTGGSSIPTPITPPKNLLETPQEQAVAEDPLLRWKQMQEERLRIQREQQQQEIAQQQNPQNEERQKELAQEMTTQVGAVLGKQPIGETKHLTVLPVSLLKKKDAGTGTTIVNGQVVANGQTAVPTAPAKIIIAAGDMAYAQTVLEANSDTPGPVVALLASGPFAGGKLMGTFTTNNEYLMVQFKTLITKKGTSLPIDAYAVDPATSLTGMATDVDHRYFSRIVIPAAVKFIEGMGSAIAETTTSTSQSSTSTTTSTSKPNLKEQLGKAFEEASNKASTVIDADAGEKKILVRIRAGTPIGVLFMQALTDQTIKQAQSGVLSQQVNNNQRQQNGQLGGVSQLQLLQQSLFSQQQQQQQNGMQGQGVNQQNAAQNALFNQLFSDDGTGNNNQTQQQTQY